MNSNSSKLNPELVDKHFVNAPDTGLGHYQPITIDKNYGKEFDALLNKILDKDSVELGKFLVADSREMTQELFKQKIDSAFKETKDLNKSQIVILSMLREIYNKSKDFT